MPRTTEKARCTIASFLYKLFKSEDRKFMVAEKPQPESPSTVLAYMIAQELLLCEYELETGYPPPKPNDTLYYLKYAGSNTEPFKITHPKFVLKGHKSIHTLSNWVSSWAYLIDYQGKFNFNDKEQEIVLRAFHKSLTYRAERAKIKAETERQEKALTFIEEWMGLV